MINIAIVIVFALGFGYMAVRRLDWAMLVIIAALPSYLLRFKVWGLPSTILELMIWLVLAVWLVNNYAKIGSRIKQRWQGLASASSGQGGVNRYPFDWEMVVILVVAWLASWVAEDGRAALGIFKAYFFDAIVFYVLYINILGRKENLPRVARALGLSAVLVSGVAWYQGLVDMQWLNPVWSQQSPVRATAIFPYANAVGLYLAPIVMILIGYAVSLWKFARERVLELALIMVALVMSLGSIYWARSEGALVALVVSLVIWGLLVSQRSRLIILVLLAVGLAMVSVRPEAKDWLEEKARLKDLAGEIRKQQWRETKKMLVSDWRKGLLGVGLSGFPRAVKPFHQEGIFFDFDNDPDFQKNLKASTEYRATHWQPVDIYQYPHNIVLNFWVELGLLGVLIFGWLLLKFWYYASLLYSKKGEMMALALGLAMLVMVIHGLVDVPYFKNDLAVLWWLIIAMMASLMIDYERSFAKNNRR